MTTIKGFENYAVDDQGNIFSLPKKTRKGIRILKSIVGKNGYPMLDLCKDGQIKRFLVHRLIAQTLLPNPNNKEQVNHINGNKLDNRLSNLTITVKNKKLPSSGFRGVHKHRDSWRVILLVDGKRIRVCGFKNPEIAARKYDELAKLYYGDSAILNFPCE
jgi:hypothetical protein